VTATLNSYIYIVDGYRASHGPVGPHFFSETDLMKTVSVNVLTEAVVLVTEAVPLCCPPRLIDFARRLFLTASVNKK